MASTCPVCDLLCNDDSEKSFVCDSCGNPYHVSCAGLSTSEVKCLESKKRVLKFFCPECEQGFKALPQVLSKLNKLNEEILNIKKFIGEKRNADFDRLNSYNPVEIYSEVAERIDRQKNLMFYNLKESSFDSPEERKNYDEKQVISALKNIANFNEENIKVYRVSKFIDHDHIRPIKIRFENSDTVLSLLKNNCKIPDPLRISSDLTKNQRDYLNKLRDELKTINKNKTTKTIKFINGVPQIVDIKVKKNERILRPRAQNQNNQKNV
ncbi:hypothetical protein R5R35_010784 [Gryllus longicercus]|uniref:PHD-type domain-containing protein n=1 Tax=Gryllus longicercus TaxID=2509291 RepID=A0AAN9VF68_9ORTH